MNTPLICGDGQHGALLCTEGWDPGYTLRARSVVYVDGIKPYHAPSGQVSSHPKPWTVAEDCQANKDGLMLITLTEPLLPLQNVQKTPVDKAMVWTMPCTAVHESYY